MFELRHVHKSFVGVDGLSAAVLKGISIRVLKGEIFGIIGLSGAGKSTLLRTFNLLESPHQGQVYFRNKELTTRDPQALREARLKIGMIFQNFNLLSNRTVADNVALPLKIAGRSDSQIVKRVGECLELVKLSGHLNSYPHQLSGGQKQRVAIARAMANHPVLLLADEPTSALDPVTKVEILDCLAEMSREFGLSIVLATHEMNIVRRLCHRVALLEAGEIVEVLPIIDRRVQPLSILGRTLLEIA